MFVQVAVDLAIDQPLDYAVPAGMTDPGLGRLCVVPLGRRRCVGISVGLSETSELPANRIRPIARVIEPVAPLTSKWLELTRFAADYYQHRWGEVAIPALPPLLRSPPGPRFDSVLRRLRSESSERKAPLTSPPPDLNADQRAAVEAITARPGFSPTLLFGVTGSGKTAVYLDAIARIVEADHEAQCLLLVPEINLTPQLLTNVCAHFPSVPVVSMHSGMSDRERSAAWLAAHEGRARIIVGTRLAVLASLPKLRMIVVDEEHDASYKAGEGVRLSARDLAIKRAQIEDIPVILGSATPSLESWEHAQAQRYRLLRLRQRVEARSAPAIELIDLGRSNPVHGISEELRCALTDVVSNAEQALVFINRRGYAPVLACAACGWLSSCGRCSVFAAFHKADGTLRCHHCGWQTKVPSACPTCGNQDIGAVGQGTQRIEEELKRLLPGARIARIDRDTTRRRGVAESAFAAVHAGETDVLVGTQMITKGHDFQRIALVGVLNADAQLLSHDFRAPERLFATLMQVAGRAGRTGKASRVLLQTRYPRHPLLAAFSQHDYEGFARSQLAERRAAGMPPFVSQALLVAEARQLEPAMGFLAEARHIATTTGDSVTIFDPVPMPIVKVDRVYRAQLLAEASRRRELQSFLRSWLAEVRRYAQAYKPRVRWRIEVDPQEI
ncbi:MAG: primosomal protein N' [Gemmatimonadota bacterium]